MKISRLDYTEPVLLPKELLSSGCCFVALGLSYPCYSTWSGSILRLDKQFAAWSIILERLVLHSLVFVYTPFFQVFLSNDLQQPITNQTRAPRPTGFRHWQRPLITLPIFVCEEMIIPGSLWFIMIHLCACIVRFWKQLTASLIKSSSRTVLCWTMEVSQELSTGSIGQMPLRSSIRLKFPICSLDFNEVSSLHPRIDWSLALFRDTRTHRYFLWLFILWLHMFQLRPQPLLLPLSQVVQQLVHLGPTGLEHPWNEAEFDYIE